MYTIEITTQEGTIIKINHADITLITYGKVVFYVEGIRFEIYLGKEDCVKVVES